MRELKFRAWDKTNKKMLDRVLAGPGDPCSIVWNEERHEWLNFDKFCGDIMQFTGLKDKNGIEVYEGDIVKAVLIGFYSEREEVLEQVTIDQDGHLAPFFMRVHCEEEWWKDCLVDGFEVIGNVYEHPELISQKK